MYELTLSQFERQAMDWIGDRYEHGTDLANLLIEHLPNDTEWCNSSSITFKIPEHKAWEIKELIDNSLLECIDTNFAMNLLNFAGRVV